MGISTSSQTRQLLVAAAAAFCTYFCMYAFRKPFTAATFPGEEVFGLGLKTVLVISQLAGYMISKFIGIKVVSEMRSEYRAVGIVGLVLTAELALVGFAVVPLPWKPVMFFLNGLPLGMVFGLVLAYLEGRQQTEALSAALCASFIVSSGVVKSVGQWLMRDYAVSQYSMPMVTGLLFLPALLISVWLLQRTPPPNEHDQRSRAARNAMTRDDRRRFFTAYWPGLSLLVFVYVALTVIRTIRDDFGVEIWADMGVTETPSVFAKSETIVAVCVVALNGLAIWITHNLAALRVTVGLMCASFALVAGSTLSHASGLTSPLVFMVACGVGLYVPYVAFHTTVFERLIAASRHPSNLGFLMYLADAMGYLGYAIVIVFRAARGSPMTVLPFFQMSLLVVAVSSMVGLVLAFRYFQRVLAAETELTASADGHPLAVSLATVDSPEL